MLSNPTSLLFAIEKPNIFRDELIEMELIVRSGLSPSTTLEAIEETLASLTVALRKSFGPDLDNGPLRLFGNELVCKWAYRLLSLRGVLTGGVELDKDGGDDLTVLRRTYL